MDRSILDASDLRDAGLKSTLPRVLILSLFKSSPEAHLSAEEVYRSLIPKHRALSLSTIYRVLAQLTQAGLIERHQWTSERGATYELSGKRHHDHCVCCQCGHIEEFHDAQIEVLQQKAADQHGFQLNTHALVIFCKCQIQDCPHRQGASSRGYGSL